MLIPNPDLDFWNSDPKIHFWANLGPKIQSYSFCLKIGTHRISRMLIPNPDLDFWNIDSKIHFWASLGPRSQSCPFCLKIGTYGISRMLILIPPLVFWISNPNFLFGQIWAKKVKVVSFAWKLVHMLSRGCWFLFPHYFSEFQNLNPFLGKFEPKNSKLYSFEKLSCQSWKLTYRVFRRCWFLFRHYFSQFPTLNPFLDKFGLKNSKFLVLTENWHTWYIEDADSYSNNSFLNRQP